MRLGSRAGLETAGLALLNWVADIGCLAACVAAFGVSIPWSRLVLLYMAGIGAATFNLTPAGIGVVEVALAATAASFGIAKRDAMASALLYRGVSSWLIIAAGWVVFALLRRSRQTAIAESLGDEAIGDVVVVPAFGAVAPTPVAGVPNGAMAVACSGVSAGE